jgi:energy-coupling factor transporter ATP-binding protein EcfA2
MAPEGYPARVAEETSRAEPGLDSPLPDTPLPETPLIDLCGVSYTYDGETEPILHDVTLRVQPGEFVLILGSSGCGKSTLLQIFNGVIPHSLRGRLTGSARCCGQDVATTKIAAFAADVGMVFQDPEAQIINTRIRDEVCFCLENLRYPPGEILQRQAEALALVGLADAGDRSIWDLSGGQKQRVSVAAVLAARPRLLVLDEPTANLDPSGMREVFAVLDRLRTEVGTTIVLVEHRVDELADRVSRVVMMEAGRIVFDGAPREAFARRRISATASAPPQAASANARSSGTETNPVLPDAEADALRPDATSNVRSSRTETSVLLPDAEADALVPDASAAALPSGAEASARLSGVDANARASLLDANARSFGTVQSSGAWFPQLAEFALELAASVGQPVDPAWIPLNQDEALERSEQFLASGLAAPFAPVSHTSDSTPSPAAEPLLTVAGLRFGYDSGIPILDNVSFTLPPATIVALLGRNGCGKTTLARILMGINPPPKGVVSLLGRDLATLDTTQIAAEIGYVFQNPDHQFVTDRVDEEVAYGLRVRGWSDAAIAERLDDVLAVVDLDRYRTRSPFSLSLGERRRLSVATVLVLEPKLLILDEPTIGQDYERAQQLMGLMARLRQRYRSTVLMITHDVRLVAEWADRAIVLGDGRVRFDGTPINLFAETALLDEVGLMAPPLQLLSAELARRHPQRVPHATLAAGELVGWLAGA